jgi:hypothetical protein
MRTSLSSHSLPLPLVMPATRLNRLFYLDFEEEEEAKAMEPKEI